MNTQNTTTLKAQIQALEEGIVKVNNDIQNIGIYIEDFIESYDELLDSDGTVVVAGHELYISEMIKEHYPIIYNCGLNAYVDTLDADDNPEYEDLTIKLAELTDELKELQEATATI
jgi:prefoldin subunit 5